MDILPAIDLKDGKAVTVNGKHGQYQSHRWIKPNYAKQILDR